jgi:hypothetical protein
MEIVSQSANAFQLISLAVVVALPLVAWQRLRRSRGQRDE